MSFKIILEGEVEGEECQSNKFQEFLGGSGNFLPLIDCLDGCHNESVNTKVLQLFVNLLTGDPSYI